MSNFLEEKILIAELVGGGRYVALYTSNPGEDDTGAEVLSTGYVRKGVTFSSPVQSVGQATVQNTALLEWEPIAAGYGTVTHIGIRDASSGGNLLFYKALDTPVVAGASVGIRVPVGDLKVSLD